MRPTHRRRALAKPRRDESGHVDIAHARRSGERRYVVPTNQGEFGVSAKDGRLLWQFDQRYCTEVVNSPIIHGPLVYVSRNSFFATTYAVQSNFINELCRRSPRSHQSSCARIPTIDSFVRKTGAVRLVFQLPSAESMVAAEPMVAVAEERDGKVQVRSRSRDQVTNHKRREKAK